MSANPWMKFFPSDWRGDPALRMCSLGARGLWMEMLCVMHESLPRGSLLVNSLPVNERQLAILTGCTMKEISTYLTELEVAGVFSRDEDGTIFSRRIRRDDEKAAKDKANGKTGGNPALKRGVNPPDNPPVNGQDKAHIPESRNQKDSEANASAALPPRSTPRTRLFNEGLSTLAEISGRGSDACRSLIGKWLKVASDDAIEVLAAIEEAQRNRAASPVPWIEARFRRLVAEQSNIARMPIVGTRNANPRGSISKAADYLIAELTAAENSSSRAPGTSQTISGTLAGSKGG